MNFAARRFRSLASMIGDYDMRKKKVALRLSPLGLLTLAACGGSGGTSGSGITVTGNVQKGPLSDAFVFLKLIE